MRRVGSQRSALLCRVRRIGAAVLCFGFAALLGGCLLKDEKPAAGLDIPDAYREGPRHPDVALPSVEWWRGFRSKQLTDLIEESLTSNLDIAAAVARIVQADATSRVAGAPLLPAVTANPDVTRSRASQSTGSSISGAS